MSNDSNSGDSGDPSEADRLSDELAKKYDPERLLSVIAKRAGRGDTLDHSLRLRYERRFGVDLSHVRIYSNEFAERFNKDRNSFAVTVGGTGMILMGNSPDRSMHTAAGQALLAHELTHVAQKARGLHFSAPLAGEESETEREAGEVEADVLAEQEGNGNEEASASTEASAAEGAQAIAAMKAKDAMLQQIRDRVLEMISQSEHSRMVRNGNTRRP